MKEKNIPTGECRPPNLETFELYQRTGEPFDEEKLYDPRNLLSWNWPKLRRCVDVHGRGCPPYEWEADWVPGGFHFEGSFKPDEKSRPGLYVFQDRSDRFSWPWAWYVLPYDDDPTKLYSKMSSLC
jgi:hypothetical protein